MRINETEDRELIILLQRFSQLNDLNPLNTEQLNQLVYFLKKDKGFVYIEAMQNALKAWSAGGYEEVRKPRRLNSRFICSLIDLHISSKAKFNQTSEVIDVEKTPEEIEQIMQNGYRWKKKAYFEKDIPVMWLFSLYDWMERKGMIALNDFDDNQVKERIEEIREKAYKQRKTKKSWDITPITQDNILKVAIVSLEFEKQPTSNT